MGQTEERAETVPTTGGKQLDVARNEDGLELHVWEPGGSLHTTVGMTTTLSPDGMRRMRDLCSVETGVRVTPQYASINAVADICEPWIEFWGGDEWGEVMRGLHMACHTSYGFSDEDCALFAAKLIENLETLKGIADDDPSYFYEHHGEERLEKVRQRCRELREYWRQGGNLRGHEPYASAGRETVDSMPGWLFGD